MTRILKQQLKEQLKHLRKEKISRVNPDADWILKNRIELLSQIRMKSAQAPTVSSSQGWKAFKTFLEIFAPDKFLAFSRPVFVSVLAFALVIGGWVMGVSAAQNSLPGDMLWNVKLAGEKTKIALASVGSSKSKKTDMHLDFAGRRAQEIKEVVANKKVDNVESINSAVDSLKKSIETASQNLGEAVEQNDKDIAKVAGKSDDKLEKIIDDLEETKKAAKNGPSLELEDVKGVIEKVTEASKVAEQAGVKTLEVLLNNSVNGSQEIVKEKVEKKIERLENKFTEIKHNVEGVGITVSTTLANKISTSTIVNINNTTSTLDATMVNLVQATGQKVQEAGVQVEKTLSEAKTFLEQNNLTSAFEKMKELSAVNAEIAGVVEETTLKVTESIAINDALLGIGASSSTTSLGAGVISNTASSSVAGASNTQWSVISSTVQIIKPN